MEPCGEGVWPYEILKPLKYIYIPFPSHQPLGVDPGEKSWMSEKAVDHYGVISNSEKCEWPKCSTTGNWLNNKPTVIE